jgi:hypothetical protein
MTLNTPTANAITLGCTHCGDRLTIPIPTPPDVAVGRMLGFTMRHRRCQAQATVQAPAQVQLDDPLTNPDHL